MKIKDPTSGISHLIGGLLSITGTIILLLHSSDAVHYISFSIFGASMIILYFASATYHLWGKPREEMGFLRKLDHASIYLLIAGTYTPFCLILVKGAWGWSIFAAVWILAIAGISISFCEFGLKMPRWFSTLLYILMGWIGVFMIYPMRFYPMVLFYIFLGGIFYTIGAVIYAIKKPNLGKHFDFHDLFHIFVLLGTIIHFFCIYKYLI